MYCFGCLCSLRLSVVFVPYSAVSVDVVSQSVRNCASGLKRSINIVIVSMEEKNGCK